MKETIVIYHDAYAFNKDNRDIEIAIGQYQTLLNEFNGLHLPFKIANIAELTQLATGGERYILDTLIAGIEPQKIGGIMQDPAKVVSTLQLPNFDRVKNLGELCRPYWNMVKWLTLSGQAVVCTQEQKENLYKAHTVYADTPEKLEAYKAGLEVCAALERWNKALSISAKDGLGDGSKELRYFFRFPEPGKITINQNYYASIRYKMAQAQKEKQ